MKGVLQALKSRLEPRLLTNDPLYVGRINMRRRFVRLAAPVLRGRDVLDLGCGRQPYRSLMAARSYVGVDIEPSVRPQVVAVGDRLPFAASSFTGVVCSEVLEHTPHPERVLADIRRVLAEGGLLYVTVPQMWYLHYEPHDYFRFTSHGLRSLLQGAHFRVLRVERQGGLALFLFLRSVEFLHRVLFHLVPPIVSTARRTRIAATLLAPYQLFGLLFVSIVDRFSKRDAIGWAMLAEAVPTESTSSEALVRS